MSRVKCEGEERKPASQDAPHTAREARPPTPKWPVLRARSHQNALLDAPLSCITTSSTFSTTDTAMIQAQHLLRATAARSLTRGATRFATTAAARPTKAAAAAVKPPAARAATTVAAKSAPAKAAAAPAASAPTAAEPAGVESAAPSLYDADSVPGENWSASFSGMSAQPFEPRIAEILLQPINEEDVEIKPGE